MKVIQNLRMKFSKDEFEFSKHAVDQTILRKISVQEIRDAMRESEIIEDYPTTSISRAVCCWVLPIRTDRFLSIAVNRREIWLRLSQCMNRILPGGLIIKVGDRHVF